MGGVSAGRPAPSPVARLFGATRVTTSPGWPAADTSAAGQPEKPALNSGTGVPACPRRARLFLLAPPLAASMGRAGGGGQFLNRGANKEAIASRTGRDACPTILSNYSRQPLLLSRHPIDTASCRRLHHRRVETPCCGHVRSLGRGYLPTSSLKGNGWGKGFPPQVLTYLDISKNIKLSLTEARTKCGCT
jgi:hypothetical protein